MELCWNIAEQGGSESGLFLDRERIKTALPSLWGDSESYVFLGSEGEHWTYKLGEKDEPSSPSRTDSTAAGYLLL